MSSSEPQTKEFKTSSTNLVLNDIVLLEHIFSLAENSLLAKCALVCSDWSRSALAILWDELTSVVPLLSILAPFEEDSESGSDVFTRPIFPRDWDRFHIYARRVRHLTICDKDASTLHPSVAVELLRKRPTLVLTPNLVKLNLNSNGFQNSVSTPLARDLAMLFMNESLREIMTDLPRESELIDSLLQEIAYRAPKLKKLILNTNLYRSSALFESSLVELISLQQNLTTVCVPQNALSPAILDVLSKLPSLKDINVDLRDMNWQEVVFEHLPLAPFLEIGSFQRLEGLRLTTFYEEMIPLLKQTSIPDKLKHLSIFPARLPSKEVLKELLGAISSTCVSLHSLVLDAIPLDWEFDRYQQVERNNHKITSSILFALKNIEHLETFRLRYPFPLLVSNEDIMSFLSRFPKLTKLEFNCIPMLWREPDVIEEPSLDVTIILEIAQAFPLLQDLTLYLPRISRDLLTALNNRSDIPMLTKLREFDLSSTRFSEDLKYPLADFLGKICPPKCAIQALDYWYRSIDTALQSIPDINTLSRWKDMQVEIERIVKELRTIRSQIEDRARSRVEELESQVERLKAQLSSLHLALPASPVV